eukprot:GGOE01014564.1.p1 GENE.GGOE01014564.1~~GGOE01014564.1.p1  ORF type:complete len:212 (+),score=63.05 GGOE01014564.1:80-715(+)
MPSRDCVRRLQKELMLLQKTPVPHIVACPKPSDILEWHYVIEGPPDTPYAGGHYHGMLKFPPDYPYQPPSIYMITPNGRFKTNTRLCLSMSDFHPANWNPLWSMESILTGLLSFMLEDKETFGSITTSLETKRRLAAESFGFNLKDKVFCELFPEWKVKAMEAEARLQAATASTSSPLTAAPSESLQEKLRSLSQTLCFILTCITIVYIVW